MSGCVEDSTEATSIYRRGDSVYGRKEDRRMISRIPVLLFAVLMLLPLMPADTSAVVTGEEGLFSAVAPDTVIVLDISASMQTNPMDEMGTVNGEPDQPIKLYGNADCSGTTFYRYAPERAMRPSAGNSSSPSGPSSTSSTTTRTGSSTARTTRASTSGWGSTPSTASCIRKRTSGSPTPTSSAGRAPAASPIPMIIPGPATSST